MRIAINLATQPFVELRPLFARLRITIAALALTAIALGFGLHAMSAAARADQSEMDSLKAQTLAAVLERQNNETRMKEPQNQAILERAHFLNDLFAHKSFSWTSVMMDLERVLPAGVQVTSIEPSITAEGNVNIHLRVTGERDQSVELVRTLEHSQRFLSPRLNNETAQTKEPGSQAQAMQPILPGGVEFDIMSGYNPLPESSREREEAEKEASRQSEPQKTTEPQMTAPVAAQKIVGAKVASAQNTPQKIAPPQRAAATQAKPSAGNPNAAGGKPSAALPQSRPLGPPNNPGRPPVNGGPR